MFEWANGFGLSICFTTFVVLLASLDGSIVNPSIALFLQNELDESSGLIAGVAIGAFPLVMTITIVPCFLLSKSHFHAVFVAGLLCLVIGNTIYGAASHPLMIIFGRGIAGVGGASTLLAYKYGPTAVPAKQELIVSMARTAAAVGYVVGPGIAYVFTLVNTSTGKLHLNEYTLPGYASALAFLVCTLLEPFVVRTPVAKGPAQPLLPAAAVQAPTPNDESFVEGVLHLLRRPGAVACIVVACAAQFCFLALITANADITQAYFGWGVSENSLMYVAVGVASLVASLAMVFASATRTAFSQFVIGSVLLIVGPLCMFSYPNGLSESAYYVGAIATGVGYTVVSNHSNVLFIASFGDRPSEVVFSLYLALPSAARFVSPFLTGAIMLAGSTPNYVFAASLIVACLSFGCLMWHRRAITQAYHAQTRN